MCTVMITITINHTCNNFALKIIFKFKGCAKVTVAFKDITPVHNLSPGTADILSGFGRLETTSHHVLLYLNDLKMSG